MTITEPKIRVRDLNTWYDQMQVLNNVNVDIPANQITIIMGPSGCGKTTLLKSFNRFLELSSGTRVSGSVQVDGKDIYDNDVDVTEVRKHNGLIAQRPFPLPMSIYDNVAYGLRIHGRLKRKELDGVVEHYLRTAGLWEEVCDRLHEPATGLSIGQQQRLCLARGLAVEPAVLLGDEPTSALDPISSQFFEERLQELKGTYTTVMVTHILRQARRLADHVIFMYMGEVVEAGPAKQVFENPQEERTRAYLAGQF